MSTPCELYAFNPSFALAVIAVIGFSSLTAVHSFRMVRSRAWNSLFFVLGGLAELSGYTARLVSTQDACNRAAYGVQSVLLLLGPSLIMVSVNITQTDFARLLRAGQFCWVPITWQQPLYLGINGVLLVLQAIGGILTISSSSIATIATGSKLTIAVYVTQTFFWLFTLAEHLYMTIKLSRYPTEASKTCLPNWKQWKNLFGLAVSIIATGRNIMRLTMAGGIQFLVVNEWPSYAFDGYQMFVVLGAWTIWYLPQKCLRGKRRGDYNQLVRGRIDGNERA